MSPIDPDHKGPPSTPRLGVGIGYRGPIRNDILRHLGEIDFLEIVSDAFFRNPAGLRALASLVPCVPHSLNLSVGSEVDDAYLFKVQQLVGLTRPPWHTDHLAFTKADGISVGHLAPVQFSQESLDICVRNIRKVQDAIDVPFAVETITVPFHWPDDTMEEHEFLNELVKRTGCHLLLDLENMRINAANHGGRAEDLLDRLPLESVLQLHLAGGTRHGGLEHDSHSEAIPAGTWSLLERFCELAEPCGVVIERDGNFPPFGQLLGEVRRARGIVARAAA